MTMTGKAWKFGNDISTDLITPGRYFHLRSNINELAKYTLIDARKDYVNNVSNGDFVVAGKNFGLGSSREHAPIVIKISGAAAVIAESFSRIFYRNCINIGLPAITFDTSKIDDGDIIELTISDGVLVNKTKNLKYNFTKFPKIMNDILNSNGLLNYIKNNKDLKV
tara:strand:- start:7 stop:504 length:498 start_codon:yes stop_codon:yes gene_type:complete